jgi:hypothetical protein
VARYFEPGSNPVVLNVLGRDTIVAMGKPWSTIVVQAIIKTSSLFRRMATRVYGSPTTRRA